VVDPKESAVMEILALAAEHNIITIVIRDHNPNLEISCHRSIDVSGSMRGNPVEGTNRLRQRTLQLELKLKDDDVGRRRRLLN
jgi:hypothetical protein